MNLVVEILFQKRLIPIQYLIPHLVLKMLILVLKLLKLILKILQLKQLIIVGTSITVLPQLTTNLLLFTLKQEPTMLN